MTVALVVLAALVSLAVGLLLGYRRAAGDARRTGQAGARPSRELLERDILLLPRGRRSAEPGRRRGAAQPRAEELGLVHGVRPDERAANAAQLVAETGEPSTSTSTPLDRSPDRPRPDGVLGEVRPLGDGYIVIDASDETEAGARGPRRDFVANVSHELKTPVGAVALLAEAASSGRRPGGGRAVRHEDPQGVGPAARWSPS